MAEPVVEWIPSSVALGLQLLEVAAPGGAVLQSRGRLGTPDRRYSRLFSATVRLCQ